MRRSNKLHCHHNVIFVSETRKVSKVTTRLILPNVLTKQQFSYNISLPLQEHMMPRCTDTLLSVLTPLCCACIIWKYVVPLFLSCPKVWFKNLCCCLCKHTLDTWFTLLLFCAGRGSKATHATSISNSALLIRFCFVWFPANTRPCSAKTQSQAYHFQVNEPSAQQCSSWWPRVPGGSPRNECQQ